MRNYTSRRAPLAPIDGRRPSRAILHIISLLILGCALALPPRGLAGAMGIPGEQAASLAGEIDHVFLGDGLWFNAPEAAATSVPRLDSSAGDNHNDLSDGDSGVHAGTATAPGDEYWSDAFTIPGVAGVGAFAIGPDGSVYAAGTFGNAGGVLVNHVARWDGAAWHPLGSGVNNSPVYALAFGPDGSLYAAGTFTEAGGVAANRVARWDGSSWHALGTGLSGPVRALAVGPDGTLYAGGNFNVSNGTLTSRVARWDGAVWHPVGDVTNLVSALAIGLDGSLYAAGGYFIARWDGAAWVPLGSLLDWFYALDVGPDGSIYAGGEYRGRVSLCPLP